MEEIGKLKKRRERKALERAQREEEAMAAKRHRSAPPSDFDQSKLKSDKQEVIENQTFPQWLHDDEDEGEFEMKAMKGDTDHHHQLRKPKYLNRVHTGYEWNKYNQTHYDHRDNPPPKFVQGYKFVIFYTDLEDKKKAPSYTIEKDGNNIETCILRFHGGPPYEDIAFRIINKEWEYSMKKGFKCTFEGGILRLYFNFKRFRYRK